MCIVCENKAPTDYKLNCRSCRNIVNDTLKKYVLKYTVKELDCSFTKITEVPHIVGLKKLECYYTNITEVPHIVGLEYLDCYKTQITEIPHIVGLKELECSNTKITEIPHIIGLKYLNCSNTNITKIPDIEGCYIITNNCYWLDKLHIEKVITTQKMIRNYYMRKKLIHIRDQLIPIYFHPEMKGGYLHKKSMMADF